MRDLLKDRDKEAKINWEKELDKKNQLLRGNFHFNTYDVFLTYFYNFSGLDQLHQQSHKLSFIGTTKQGVVCTVQSCLFKVSKMVLS